MDKLTEEKINLDSIIEKYNITDINEQMIVEINMYPDEIFTSSTSIKSFFEEFENSFPIEDNWSDRRKYR